MIDKNKLRVIAKGVRGGMYRKENQKRKNEHN